MPHLKKSICLPLGGRWDSAFPRHSKVGKMLGLVFEMALFALEAFPAKSASVLGLVLSYGVAGHPQISQVCSFVLQEALFGLEPLGAHPEKDDLVTAKSKITLE